MYKLYETTSTESTDSRVTLTFKTVTTSVISVDSSNAFVKQFRLRGISDDQTKFADLILNVVVCGGESVSAVKTNQLLVLE